MHLRLLCLFIITPYLLEAQSLNAFSRLTPAVLASHHISRIVVNGHVSYRSTKSPLLPLTYELNKDGYPVSCTVQDEQAVYRIERRADNRPTFTYYTYQDRPGEDTLFMVQYVYNADGRISKVYDYAGGELTMVKYDSQGRASEISAYHAMTDARENGHRSAVNVIAIHRFDGRRQMDSMISPACRMYTEKMKYKKGKVKVIEHSYRNRRYTMADSSFHIERRLAGDFMQSGLPWQDNDYSPGCNMAKLLKENETATPNECFTRLNKQQQAIEKVFYDRIPRPNEAASRMRQWLIGYEGDLPEKIVLHRVNDGKEDSSIEYEVKYEYLP